MPQLYHMTSTQGFSEVTAVGDTIKGLKLAVESEWVDAANHLINDVYLTTNAADIWTPSTR